MQDPIASGEALYRYIPQRPPMVLLDALLRNDEELTRCSYKVPEDGLFVEKGVLREPGMLESIAQTAAAGVGHYQLEMKKEGDEAPLGFIAQVKNFEVNGLPRVGDLLYIEVGVEQEVMNMTIIQGRLLRRKEVLARCEMRIYLQEKEVPS